MNWCACRFRTAVLGLATMVSLPLAASAYGQEPEDAPTFRVAEPNLRMEASILDVDKEGAPRRKSGASVTTKGRVRTTLLVDRGRDVKIIEDPKRGILMEVTQHYDSKRFGKLKGEYPELKDYLDLFPTEIGDQEIELKLSLKQKYKAKDSARLKIESLEAFEIYRRHVKRNGDHLAKFR